ncbi:hypothetical protein LTR37_014120 [Vermiconidia calcicola]|uniref:Uncharacterized protein n=1 Tax=Vermiconidia calcicola TaxID=1690605 RepID=A0ACC3MVE3_9PEZI|nr:hypothetical protein LTR37_014120 [Vermiconidia calcicola]
MLSQAPLCTSQTSHSLRSVSTSCDPADSSSPSPGLYVTFKVLQLVNSFRKRVKTRVQSEWIPKKETWTRVAEDFCQDFEHQAFDEIDQYLGRKTGVRSRKRVHPQSIRRRTNDDDWKSSERESVKVATATKPTHDSTKSIQWLLDELNQSVKSGSQSLSTVAASDKLFVDRKSVFHIERLPLEELIQLLVVVKDLLDTFRRAQSSHCHVKTLAEGNELLDLYLDETATANLEHLLACLKDQLLRLLVAKLVELVHKHVIECQRDRCKHCEEWFCEFPDAQHPLSTTWPWSIRPSLAVLWGVCWMFYDFFLDPDGNMFDEQGQMVATRHELDTFILEDIRPQRQHQQPYYPPGE